MPFPTIQFWPLHLQENMRLQAMHNDQNASVAAEILRFPHILYVLERVI